MKRQVIVFFILVLMAPLIAQPSAPVVMIPGQQGAHQMVPDGNNGAVVVWQDSRTIPSQIYAQRIDEYGNMLWGGISGIPVCPIPGTGIQSDVCIANVGGTGPGATFIVAWQDGRLTGNVTSQIWAQKLDLNGNLLWGPAGICVDNLFFTPHQASPEICPDGAGGAFITWVDDRASAMVDFDIYAIRIDTNGVLIPAANGVLISAGTSPNTYQGNPVICATNSGGAIIAYENQINTVDICAQEINSLCGLVWPGELVVCGAGASQINPLIVSDQSSGAFICWEDYRSGTDVDIYIQLVDSGLNIWTVNGFGLATFPGVNERRPALTSGGPGSAIVAWAMDGADPSGDLLAQKISGTPAIPTPTLNWWMPGDVPVCGLPGYQGWVEACPDGAGGAFFVWEDDRNATANPYDIYAEHIDSTGQVYGGIPNVYPGGFVVCTDPSGQGFPKLANNQLNQAIYVWVDNRNGPSYPYDWDLYTLDPPDPPLPVELSTFTAVATAGNFARIDWVTQSETNVSGFYLQKNLSDELSSALTITTLIPAANSAQQTQYSHTDTEVMGGQTYYYWLQSVDYDGHTEFYGPVTLTLPQTGDISGIPEIPQAIGITGVFPNPFNPLVNIMLGVGEAGQVRLAVYNARGEKVKALFSGFLEQGSYKYTWYGRDESGAICPSGVYYVKMETPDGVSLKKAVLSK